MCKYIRTQNTLYCTDTYDCTHILDTQFGHQTQWLCVYMPVKHARHIKGLYPSKEYSSPKDWGSNLEMLTIGAYSKLQASENTLAADSKL